MAAYPNGTNEKEISLTDVSRKLREYRGRINDSFYGVILFIKRYIIILAVIVIAGAALGVYMDNNTNVYDHKVFVIPNFKSTDYLYKEVELINTKIKERDYDYLSKLGVQNPDILARLDVEPVVDIYDFIDDVEENENNDRKFELFKLISESGEMDKMLEDETTSKYYKNQLLVVITNGKATREEIIDPLIAHFNADPYYKSVQEQYINSLNIEIEENYKSIAQIDSVFSNAYSGSKETSKNLVYFNENLALHELLRQKRALLDEQRENKVNLINYKSIIKEGATILNIEHSGLLIKRMKFVIPLFFIFVFVGIIMIINYYKSQRRKRLTNTL